jgi:hypothetical protein
LEYILPFGVRLIYSGLGYILRAGVYTPVWGKVDMLWVGVNASKGL